MPYVIINDKYLPWEYYIGQGFLRTSPERLAAMVFPTLTVATTKGPLHGRPDLYALGWRVIPVEA